MKTLAVLLNDIRSCLPRDVFYGPELAHCKQARLELVIGRYTQGYHLPGNTHLPLAESVKDGRATWPHTVALPHPSPCNNMWLRRNPWFGAELLPVLKPLVQQARLPADGGLMSTNNIQGGPMTTCGAMRQPATTPSTMFAA